MEKKIIVAFILGVIISSVVGVIAANTISSSSVLYKDDRTVDTVLDELFENVDAIESDDTRLTSLEGKLNTLTSTHSSDITRIDNNITSINSEMGSTDISSIGDGTITGAVSELDNGLVNYSKYTNSVVCFRSDDYTHEKILYTFEKSGVYHISWHTYSIGYGAVESILKNNDVQIAQTWFHSYDSANINIKNELTGYFEKGSVLTLENAPAMQSTEQKFYLAVDRFE